MHFIVAWEIRSVEPEKAQINNELQACLKPYSWVRPLTATFIVNVQSQEVWNKIRTDLQAVGVKYPRKISLLLSPLIQGGRYDGLLGKELWPEINARSN